MNVYLLKGLILSSKTLPVSKTKSASLTISNLIGYLIGYFDYVSNDFGSHRCLPVRVISTLTIRLYRRYLTRINITFRSMGSSSNPRPMSSSLRFLLNQVLLRQQSKNLHFSKNEMDYASYSILAQKSFLIIILW